MNDNFDDKYYGQWSNYIKYEDLLEIGYLENIEYIHRSNNKLIILDNIVNKKIAITSESIGDVNELLKVNTNLKILNGHGYKIGDYAELILPQLPNSKNLNSLFVEKNNEINFFIDKVEVYIRPATNMYILLTDTIAGYYTSTDIYTITISFKGITEHNYADYYNQALFMISTIVPENNVVENDNKCYFTTSELDKGYYKNRNYNEVFYFFNEAMRIYEREISSLYLYKILEYFFLIARKDEFNVILKDYNESNSIDVLINKITKLYKDSEKEQLIILMNSIKENLNDIINKAMEWNILKSNNIESFAEELYLYRNSIVHGKSDYKFDLKIPNALCESEKDLFWRNSLKQISEILLFKYCIQKVD